MTGVPEPWGTLLSLILGPLGAIVLLCVAVFFLWRLFREASAEAKAAQANVTSLTQAIKELTTESKTWREGQVEMMRELTREVRDLRRAR